MDNERFKGNGGDNYWKELLARIKDIKSSEKVLYRQVLDLVGTKQRHLSGNSTTVWYFGNCKTQTSYRTISIGDTLVNSLKDYKNEQEAYEKNYGVYESF